jgi:hypothetical protein
MLEMRRGQGNRHYQISKAIFTEMGADPTAGNGDRLVGVLSQAQMRYLPKSLIRSSQHCCCRSISLRPCRWLGTSARRASRHWFRELLIEAASDLCGIIVASVAQARSPLKYPSDGKQLIVSKTQWRA